MDQAIEFFEGRYRPATKSIIILKAAEEFLRTRQALSKATSANYTTGLLLLQKTSPNKLGDTFTISDIKSTPSKYKNFRSQRSFGLIKLPKDMIQIAMLSLDFAALIYIDVPPPLPSLGHSLENLVFIVAIVAVSPFWIGGAHAD